MLRNAGASVLAVGIVRMPWLIAVETTEGLAYYTRSRAELFEGTPAIAYASPLDVTSLRTFIMTSRPSNDAIVWVQQMALLVPLGLVVMTLRLLRRADAQSETDRRDACCMLLAGGFLVVVDAALLRQPSYVVVVAPLAAA
jgi:hypothetical protein